GCSGTPTFSLTNTTGWSQSPTPPAGQAISYVAFWIGDMAPLAPARTLQVSAILKKPGPDGALSEAGTLFNPCATIAMTTSGYQDARTDNNKACDDTRIPGIDLLAVQASEPPGRFPGVEPGDTITWHIGVVNSGTVPAFGITLTDVLPPEVELVAPPQGAVEVVNAAGEATGPINRAGFRIDAQASWTLVGSVFHLGLAATGPLGYDSLGLQPGDRATITLVTRVKDGVANDTTVANTVTVATTGVEEILTNNWATAEVGVFRADPFVYKTVATSSGVDAGIVDVGDTVTWRLEYGNAGDFPARQVLIEDAIPEGLAFVVGSVGGVDPDTMQVVYSQDGGATWGYVPAGASGTVDTRVTHVRVVWIGNLPAPASGVFSQTTALEFEAGTHAGTAPDIGVEGVVPVGGGKCGSVSCEPIKCPYGGYVPEGECCQVCRDPIPGCDMALPVEPGCDAKLSTWSGCYMQKEEGECDGVCSYEYVGPAAESAKACQEKLNATYTCIIKGDCTLPTTPVWDDCWRAECPNMAMWSCEQDIYVSMCAETYHVGLKTWAKCLSQGGKVEQCALLLPKDECTPCMAQACEQTELQHRSFGQYGWWNPELMAEGIQLAASAAREAGIALPASVLPVSTTIDICSEPLSCKEPAEDSGSLCPVGCIQFCSDKGGCQCRCEVGIGLGATLIEAQAPTASACPAVADSLSDDYVGCLAEVVRAGAQGDYAYLFSFDDSGRPQVDLVDTETHEIAISYPAGQVDTWTWAVDPRYLWVVDNSTGELIRAERANPQNVARVELKGNVYGLAVDLDSVWVASESSELVWQVDRETMAIIEHPVPNYINFSNELVAVDHNEVWVATNEAFIAVLDKNDPTATFRQVDLPARDDDRTERTLGIALDGDSLWVSTVDHVFRMDRETEEFTRVTGIQQPDSSWDIWTVEVNDDWAWAIADALYRIDKQTLEVTVIEGIEGGFGLSPSAEGVWVNGEDADGNMQYLHVANDGSILGTTRGGDDFYAGDVTGYIYDRTFPPTGVALDPSVCDFVKPPACDLPAECTGSTYTSPAFPADDEGNVTSWGRAIIGQAAPADQADKTIRYSVLNADSGEAIAGFDGVPYPAGGVLDLGSIDPATHPHIQLRAEFTGLNVGIFSLVTDGAPSDGECGASYDVYALNEVGQVAGVVSECRDIPFIWSRSEGMTRIWPEDDFTQWAYAYALNDAGVVAGRADGYNAAGKYEQRAFVWSQASGWVDIVTDVGGVHGGDSIMQSSAGAVSPDGRVAGIMRTAVYEEGEGGPIFVGERDLPFVWSADDGMITPEFDGFLTSGTYYQDAYGIRFGAQDIVAGVLRVGNDRMQYPFDVFRWDLETGEIEFSGLTLSYPEVNGLAADGTLLINDDGSGAWLWAVDADPEPIGILDTNVYASAMAPDGTVVGYSGDFDSWSAWVRHPDGTFEFLPPHPDFAGGLAATSINAHGDIGVELYAGDLSRERRTTAAIWTGDEYLLVDGTPEGTTATAFSDYSWDGFPALNDNRQLIGLGRATRFGGEAEKFGYLWEPNPDKLALLDWRVIYETDRNPSVTLTTAVEGACADAITNTATASTASPQVTTANDSSSASIAMNRADVRVVVRPDPAVVGPADETNWPTVVWHIEVINDGPGVARNIDVAVDLPGWGQDGWFIDELAPGKVTSNSYSGYSNETQANASIVGTAEITSASLDCNAANDAGSGTVFVGSWPNVWVTVDGPPAATAGTTFTHSVTWGNNGNATAPGTEITLDIPPGLTLVGIVSELCTLDGLLLDCGDVEPGTIETIEITLATADCGAVSNDAYRVGAAITTEAIEVDVSDNLAADSTQIIAPPGGITMAVTQSRGTIVAGEAVTWTVYFENTGLGAIDDTTIVVDVPAGATYVAGSASAGGTLVGGDLVWQGDRLAPGEGGAVQFALVMGSSATVTATGSGAGSCAGAAQGAITVAAQPGLAIVKAVDRPEVCGLPGASGNLTWSITVSNPTAAPIANVVVSDVVPTGMAYVAGTIVGLGADPSDAMRPTWNLGTLPAGAALTVGYQTRVVAPVTGVGGIVVGGAAKATSGQVTAMSGDTVVRLVCERGLTVTKGWNAGCALPGSERSLSLTVVNTSQAAVEDVHLFDFLPAGASFVSASTGGMVGNTFIADLGTVLPGREVVVELVLKLSPTASAGSVFTNAATMLGRGLVPQVSNQVGGAVLVCNDGNVCTTDACEPTLGCVYPDVDNGTLCDDSDACTTFDICMRGECTGTEPVVCEALSQCHEAGTCDSQTGACSNPVSETGKACDDGTVCTFEEFCTAGVCGDGGIVDCDDGNPCTVDSCDAELGCQYDNVANGTTCDDDNLCSTASQCSEGFCVATSYQSCSDNDPCTMDSCSPAEGCEHAAHPSLAGVACDDGALCTTGDVCDAEGECGGAPVVCGEPGECELEGACNEATGVCDFPTKPGDSPLPIRLTDLGATGLDSAATALAGDLTVGWVEGLNGHRIALWVDGGMTDLGAGEATGVNEAGQVVAVRGAGEVVFVDGTTAVLWTRGTVDGQPAAVFGPTDAGLVAGQAAVEGGSRPAMRLANGTVVTLAPPDATHVAEVADFEGGWVVGTEEGTTGAIDMRAVRWSGVAARELLALPTGATASAAHAVGPAGHVGGEVTTSAGEQAALWNPDGTVVVIEPACLTAGGACLSDTAIVGVDGAGRFIGRGLLADGSERAFVGEVGGDVVVIDPAGAVASSPVAISDELAIGSWETAAGVTLGFVWSEDDGLVELAAAGAGVAPTHVAGGWVLGRLTSANANQRAFLWSDRGFEDLGSLGSGTSEGAAVGDDGRVVGVSATASGEPHAFTTGVPALGCVACDDDSTAPVLVCPAGLDVVECVDGGASVAVGMPSARDACTFPVDITSEEPESFPVGTTEITFTATDGAGNAATCSVAVTVVDTTAPVITCPEARSVVQPAGVCGAEVALAATVTDGCDSATVKVLSNAPATFAVGTTEVVFTAIDAAGNQAACTTSVTVTDGTPFEITCEDDLVKEAPADACGWPEAITAIVTDECAPEVTVESDTDMFPIGESQVVFTAENDAGESDTCTTKLTVLDVTDPVIACNTVDMLHEGDLPSVIAPSASDACTAVITISDLACVKLVDGVATAFTEGCEAEVEGGAVVVGAVDAGVEHRGGVAVRWTVTATDPSDNTATLECEAELRRDRDGDGIDDVDDNCMVDANADQADFDEDGAGNACDPVDEGIMALGDGGCSGGATSGLALVLVALALVALRRRARA
ncbi:MAG: DUF11 domain-containing protein, partial [Deltaproteobacteria bacterium]|nr:DUF11 domain-containing protein [Deltaproteobacteria bacterium]